LEAGSVLPSLNFPQLDFVRPSSGFHPVTWERVNQGAFLGYEQNMHGSFITNPQCYSLFPR
jgi:hypothetical protein